MKLSTVVSTLVLAGSAVAAPGTAMRKARALARSTKPMQPADGELELLEASNNTHVEYSSNWAGAVLIGTGFTSVTGYVFSQLFITSLIIQNNQLCLTEPSPFQLQQLLVLAQLGSVSMAILVELPSCKLESTGPNPALLSPTTHGMSGTQTTPTTSPASPSQVRPSRLFFPLQTNNPPAGNSVTVTVTASSKTGGTAKITNNTTGKTVTHTFSNEASLGSLCEYNAEWIVEDFESGGSQVSFANFGTVTFTGASAVKSGTTVGVTGASILDIKQTSVLTDCSLSGSSGVICKYV